MQPGRIESHLRDRRKTVGAAILLLGATAGLVIYLTASPAQEDLLREQEEASKVYQRQMEEYGGTANVVASEIREWFDGLWHGKTLGITVACLSALLAAAVFLALTPLPPPPARHDSPQNRRVE